MKTRLPRTTVKIYSQLIGLVLCLLSIVGCAHEGMRVSGNMKMTGDVVTRLPPDNTARPVQQRIIDGDPCTCFKIAIIDVDGMMLNRNFKGSESMGENPVSLFHEKLQAAARDPNILAVVVRINSPGGSVTACDLMRRDLQQFKAATGKPVLGSIMDVGAGGGYYLATACDSIAAHPTSIVGGVGVILNLYDMRETMAQQNIFSNTIRAGHFIDLGSPIHNIAGADVVEKARKFAEATELAEKNKDKEKVKDKVRGKDEGKEEDGDEVDQIADDMPEKPTRIEYLAIESRQILERIANELHERFINAVHQSRGNIDHEQLDGRVYSASVAQQFGFIDSVMYLDEVIEQAKTISNAGPLAKVVMFHRCNDRALTEFDITPNTPMSLASIPLSIPGLDRASLPHFLYLWQPETGLEAHGY